MSSCTPSPSSLHSEESRDSTSSDFSSTIPAQYNSNAEIEDPQKAFKGGLTSHGVEDILGDGANYGAPENIFPDCKTEVLNVISNTFSQDYNSRDSTGFSIHDILGLHQSYNAANSQEDMEQRYEYQIPNYENISNSSHNNYGSGTEEVNSDDCMNKNDNLFLAPNVQIESQVTYDRNYLPNEAIRCHHTSGLDNDVVKDTTSDINESSFPNQVNMIEQKCTLMLSEYRIETNDKVIMKKYCQNCDLPQNNRIFNDLLIWSLIVVIIAYTI